VIRPADETNTGQHDEDRERRDREVAPPGLARLGAVALAEHPRAKAPPAARLAVAVTRLPAERPERPPWASWSARPTWTTGTTRTTWAPGPAVTRSTRPGRTGTGQSGPSAAHCRTAGRHSGTARPHRWGPRRHAGST